MNRPWLEHYEPHVPQTLEIPPGTLPERLRESAGRWPRRAALRFLGACLNYRELDQSVDRFAAGLQALGVAKGDRVAFQLPNCPQAVIAYYGALRAGAIVVPCNPLYVARELEHQLVDSGAKVLVLLSRFWNTFAEVRDRTPVQHAIVASIQDAFPFAKRWAYTLLRARAAGDRVRLPQDRRTLRFQAVMRDAPRAPAPVALAPEDSACLLYTGGTTGTPKGAELTHRNLLVNAHQCHIWFGTRLGEEVVPCPLPLSHGYGMTTCLNYGLYAGATLLLIPDPRDIPALMKTCERYRASFLPGVPTLFTAIAERAGGRYDLRSIRACISGGAPLPTEVRERFEALTGGKVIEGYGLSEASPVTHANPVNRGARDGTIGLPWPGVECRIVSLEDGRSDVPPGQEGELWIRGPQVMKGYWTRPSETTTVLQDGWLRTGDVAVMDADGFFRIAARKKDLIIAGGYKIFPQEIEDVLRGHPGVADAAAVGVPHRYRGETVKAFVVRQNGASASEADLIAWCRGRLAKYKVPTEIEIRLDLPRNALGKVLRRKLLELPASRAIAAPSTDSSATPPPAQEVRAETGVPGPEAGPRA